MGNSVQRKLHTRRRQKIPSAQRFKHFCNDEKKNGKNNFTNKRCRYACIKAYVHNSGVAEFWSLLRVAQRPHPKQIINLKKVIVLLNSTLLGSLI